MITTLTTDQEAKLEVYANKWINIGLSTKPTNKAKAEVHFKAIYEQNDLKVPKVVWVSSPKEWDLEVAKIDRAKVGAKVWDKVGDKVWDKVGGKVRDKVLDKVWDKVWAKVWAKVRDKVRDKVYYSDSIYNLSYLAYLDYFRELGLAEDIKPIEPFIALASDCVSYNCYDGLVLAMVKPLELHVNNEGEFHNPTGMAIRYADNTGAYYLNGKQVEEYQIKFNKTLEDILE
jgi:hypothetical protein